MWIGAFKTENGFEWVDGTSSFDSFSAWALNEPVDVPGLRCLMADGLMKWKSVVCDLSLGFVCEKKFRRKHFQLYVLMLHLFTFVFHISCFGI